MTQEQEQNVSFECELAIDRRPAERYDAVLDVLRKYRMLDWGDAHAPRQD